MSHLRVHRGHFRIHRGHYKVHRGHFRVYKEVMKMRGGGSFGDHHFWGEEEAWMKKLWGENFIGVKTSFIIKIKCEYFLMFFFSSDCIAFLTSCI